MILKFIKINFFILLGLIKSLFRLDKPNDEEKKGRISKLTKLKFIHYTKIIIPVALGRSIRGLSFQDNLKKDPFSIFINNMCQEIDRDTNIEYLFSHLKKEKFYDAATVIGLKGNLNLAKYPAWALVMPWEKISIKKKYQIYKDQFIINRSKYEPSMKKQDNLKSEDLLYSYDYVNSQYFQTKQLLESIKKKRIKAFYL